MSWRKHSVTFRQLIQLTALAVCIPVLAATAEAAKLTVKVVQSVEQSPRPVIQGATVCYRKADTPNAPVLAAKKTDSGGVAEFVDVPEGTYNVSMVANGFNGKTERVVIRGIDVAPVWALAPGQDTSGITCPATTSPQLTVSATVNIDRPPPKILSFKLSNGAESTTHQALTLKATFDRTPKFYRVAETAPTSPRWTVYNADLNGMFVFTLSDKGSDNFGTRDVYLQVKSEDGKLSEVAHLSIELKPVPVIRTFTGTQLKEVLKYAKQQGFEFSGRFIVGSNNCTDDAGYNIYGVSIDVPGVMVSTDIYDAKVYEASFFAGRRLNNHWTMKAPEFSPSSRLGFWKDPYTKYLIIKVPTSQSPSFVVQLNIAPYRENPAPCTPVELLLKSITLEGPRDLDWREAFKQ